VGDFTLCNALSDLFNRTAYNDGESIGGSGGIVGVSKSVVGTWRLHSMQPQCM
jgi:hypothetical protein